MKSFILLFIFISSTVYARNPILDLYTDSEILTKSISMLEKKFDVECSAGRSRFVFLSFHKKVKYRTVCEKFGQRLKVSVVSAVKGTKANPEFNLKFIKVKNINTLEDVDKRDPFVQAFKNSKLVQEIQQMATDQYNLKCQKGSARRGRVLNAGHYFYRVPCNSDGGNVVLRVKGQVKIVDENSYYFSLDKFRLIFP